MSPELIKVLLRHLLGAFGGAATLNDNDLSQLAGGILVAVSIGLSIYDKRKKAEPEPAPAPAPKPRVIKYGKRDA
jgi:uncharacterized membrane protein YfcA